RTIGNSLSTATVIEVGVHPDLRNELFELRSKLKTVEDHLTKTEKALELLDHMALTGSLSADKLRMRIKLNHTKKQAVEEKTEIKERILEIERTQEDTDKARVEVVSTIYAGTKLVMGRSIHIIKNTTGKVYFQLVD